MDKNNISANINKRMLKQKPISLNEKRDLTFNELEVIKSKLKTQTYKAYKNKIETSKARGLTILSKDFKTIFDKDETSLTLSKIKQLKTTSITQYTLTGTSYYVEYDADEGIILKPEAIKLIIHSKKQLQLKQSFAIAGGNFNAIKKILNKKNIYVPVVDEEGASKYLNNKQVINSFKNLGSGSNKVTLFREMTSKTIKYKTTDLAKIKLYNPRDNLPYKEFNGFRDTGNFKCVPETLLHHLKITGRNKKLTEEKVIDELREIQYDPEIGYEECSNDYGFTTETIVKFLEQHKCRARFFDINLNQFIATDNFEGKEYDKHLNTFIGIVYGKHLYYCDDAKFVKSISEKNKKEQTGYFDTIKHEKTNDEEREYSYYEVHEADNLNNIYISKYIEDNTIKKIKTLNGVITNIITEDNGLICANPEKTIMKEILGDNFKNENTTMLGLQELELWLKEKEITIPKSSFNPDVLLKIGKHGNIVKDYNEPTGNTIIGHDINKCRTACLKNNILGDYEIFSIECDIKPYSGGMKKGYYFIETEDTEFFMKGNGWYSMEYLQYAKKEGFTFTPIYELNASGSFSGDTFKDFAKNIIKKYPTTFKFLNKLIGHFGKTISKYSTGYIETDKDMAINAFWNYNKDGIGFTNDEDLSDKIIRKLKGSLCNIQPLKLPNGNTHYIVEQTKQKALYDNYLPIYNKILENEFIRVYELKKQLGGKLIRIRTDCVYVENGNPIKTGVDIGEYKREEVEINKVNITPIKNKECEEPEKLNWKVIDECEDMTMPNGSYLITGLAGYGKTYLAKQQKEYKNPATLKLAFTNVSCENLKSDDIICSTLNSYFGIDIKTGKCTEKKINNLKNIECIMITEAFMIPSYIMSILIKIKKTYPNIKWIIEGDPEQTRPVGQENINWLETKCFYELCGKTLIKLNKNKRNNECVNYNRIFNKKPLPLFNYEVRPPQNINICRTNATRIKINEIKMNKTGYFIKYDSEKHYIKGQDVYLLLDTPIMCIMNKINYYESKVQKNKKKNKKKNQKNLKKNTKNPMYNGKMYKIDSIKENKIVINDMEYTDESFMKNFVVAYAMTNQKIQGVTIREPFNIYEWNKMTTRERYTAYSRCGDGSLVRII